MKVEMTKLPSRLNHHHKTMRCQHGEFQPLQLESTIRPHQTQHQGHIANCFAMHPYLMRRRRT